MVLRRNGFNPVAQLRDEMDRLVNDFFSPVSTAATRAGLSTRSFPLLNIWEQGDSLYAEAEMPGLKSEDLDISVVDNELTMRGRRGEQPREGVAYHRQERGVGEFNRVVRLPFEVDADKVEAIAQRRRAAGSSCPRPNRPSPRKSKSSRPAEQLPPARQART